MPLFHIHGLVGRALASLVAGGSVVCTPGFHAPTFPNGSRARADLVHGGADDPPGDPRAGRRADVIAERPLRFVRSSSAPLPPRVLEDSSETFGVPVIEAYGMTEAAHQMASNPLPPASGKPGTVGPAAGPEIAVLDDGRRSCSPPGESGEIAIRGANVIAGYSRTPRRTPPSFADGWFRTGDKGASTRTATCPSPVGSRRSSTAGGEKIAPARGRRRAARAPGRRRRP